MQNWQFKEESIGFSRGNKGFFVVQVSLPTILYFTLVYQMESTATLYRIAREKSQSVMALLPLTRLMTMIMLLQFVLIVNYNKTERSSSH
jgi:hypothetical protein